MPEEKIATSIFKRYYTQDPFVDRFTADPSDAVDVVIPIIHTNELWEANLRSFYRETPVNRLLLGDGGCIDDSLEIAKKFPRVVILDHRSYKSLGYSIRRLIEEVETEWFIYLHSDVFLPEGWFDSMKSHQGKYDWFGCPMRHTVMVEYEIPEKIRPYAGSQMGRKEAFRKGLERIDDDFVYRQEDFVFADLVEREGFRHGKVEDTFHYHQTMHKISRWGRAIEQVSIKVKWDADEEVRNYLMQVKGVIKYLRPTFFLASWIALETSRLLDMNKLTWRELRQWIAETNPAWLPYMKLWRIRLLQWAPRIGNTARSLYRVFFRLK